MQQPQYVISVGGIYVHIDKNAKKTNTNNTHLPPVGSFGSSDLHCENYTFNIYIIYRLGWKDG